MRCCLGIMRCKECCSALWRHDAAAKERDRFQRVDASRDPDMYPSDVHNYTSTKQKWVVIDGKSSDGGILSKKQILAVRIGDQVLPCT